MGKAMQQLQAAGYAPDLPTTHPDGAQAAQQAGGGSGGGPLAACMDQQLMRLRALQLKGQALVGGKV